MALIASSVRFLQLSTVRIHSGFSASTDVETRERKVAGCNGLDCLIGKFAAATGALSVVREKVQLEAMALIAWSVRLSQS